MTALHKAQQLAPMIRSHSLDAQRQAQLSDEVVVAMQKGGLFDVLIPKDLGGQPIKLEDYLAVIEEVSAADASTGWCLMISATLSGYVATVGHDDLVAQVFHRKGVIIGGQTSPRAQMQPHDGDWLLWGDFRFGSGCAHAGWLLCGFRHPNPADKDDHYLVLTPRENATLRGGWDVIGLSGTGSMDYSISPTHTPNSFVLPHNSFTPARPNAVFRLGLVCVMITGHVGVALGLAKRALSEIRALAQEPRAAGQLIDRISFREQFARQTARYRGAVELTRSALIKGQTAAEADAVTDDHLKAIRLAALFATEAARDVVRFAYDSAATRAIGEDSVIGRIFRDIHVVAQHLLVDAGVYEGLGKALLEPKKDNV